MRLSELQVRQISNDIIYQRGLNYFRRGLVDNIEIEITNIKNNKAEIHLSTTVSSSSDNDWYEVEILIDGINNGIKGTCDCPSYEQKSNGNVPCKHIVAALLKYINQYQEQLNESIKHDTLDDLINDIKQVSLVGNEYKRELKLLINLFINTREKIFHIELKVGKEKLYVVKNMRTFLNAIETEDSLEFGKGFIYDGKNQNFNEIDKSILNILLEINELDKYAPSSFGFYNLSSSLISGKKAILPDKQLYKLLNSIANRVIDVNIDGIEYKNTTIYEGEMPLKFDVNLKNDKIEISQQGNLPKALDKSSRIFWYEESIYLPPEKQIRMYAPFLRLLSNQSKKTVFDKQQGVKIASYVLPALMNITKQVTLDNELKNQFYEAPLTIKTYLDKKEEFVSAEVIFNYGNYDFNPFNDKYRMEEDKILIRDIEKENTWETVLSSFGFVKNNDHYLMKNEKDIVSFITDGVNKLQTLGEVYYSEAFKGIKVYGKSSIRAGVRLNNEDLLEFTFELDGVDRSELKNIINAVKEKKKFFKLKKGGFVSLEDKELIDISNMIDYLNIKDDDLYKDKVLISKYNALYINQSIEDNNMDYVKKSDSFRELTTNIKEVRDMDYYLPDYLENIMRNYQKVGFKWFKTLSNYGFGGILADEMGLGKTLQTIAFLATERGEPSIVITPTSLVYNWKNEFEKFAPDLKIIIVSGNKDERETLIKNIKENDVVITSYPLIRRDIDAYKAVKFRYCIIDEAQQIKNPDTMNAASVKEINASGYFALTGTPIENSLTELWSIFDFIMPGYLLNHSRFTRRYENPIIKNSDKIALNELNKHIKPFILRRLKKDVIKELPPKIEHKLIIEMTEEQKKLYAAYLKSAKGEIDNEIKDKGFSRSKIKILSVLTRLRQICCDPTVFIEDFNGESGKLQALDDLLEESIEQGHKILLFSQFTSVLKNISKRLINKNIKHLYLDGATKSQDRLLLVEEFNESDTKVFLISLKAGGTGLNLTGADLVIHFDPWWNPAVEEQATDRAHRIGQSKTVEVIKLVSKGTIEEKILNLQDKKREIIKNVMDENINENNIIAQMTQEELENLFDFKDR